MKRLAYIDWMRGLACVLMFQTHCYDSWMSPEAKKAPSWTVWSKVGGTRPAPLFIFLWGGVSLGGGRKKGGGGGRGRRATGRKRFGGGGGFLGGGFFFSGGNFR